MRCNIVLSKDKGDEKVMTLKFLEKPCRRCGTIIEVRTDNSWVHCDKCHTSNCKNPDAHQTDEDRYLDNTARMDKLAVDSGWLD